VTYYQQPRNLPSTAARRNRKRTECDTTVFGQNRLSAESAHLSSFGAETEAEIRSTSSKMMMMICLCCLCVRYLALVAALASEADWVLVPEWPPERGWEEVLCNKLAQVC